MIKDLLIAFSIVFFVVVFFTTNATTPEQQVEEVFWKFCLLFLVFVSVIAIGCLLSNNKTDMKAVFIAFMGAFLFTCLWRSTVEPLVNTISTHFGGGQIFPQYQPYPWGCMVQEIQQPAARFGTKRDDMAYPEIHITEKSRAYNYITEIDDSSSNRDADFPLGANN